MCPIKSVFARRTFESDVWKQWKNSSGNLALIVDGVDEGLVKIPSFVSYLVGELRIVPIERLQSLPVCRSAEWPISEGQQLIGLWGVIEKTRLFLVVSASSMRCDAGPETLGIDAFAFMQFINKKSSVWQHCQRHCFSCLLNSVTTAFSPERIGSFTNGDVSGLRGKTIRTALKHCEHSEELPGSSARGKWTEASSRLVRLVSFVRKVSHLHVVPVGRCEGRKSLHPAFE